MVGDFDPNGTFRVVPLSRFAQGGRWRTEAMRSYARPVLIWFTKGQGRITVSGTTRGYGAHNAIFLPPGTMHGFDMLGQVIGSVVFFPPDASLELPTKAQHFRFRASQQHAEMNRLIDNISQEAAQDKAGQVRALNHYGGLLSVWLERNISGNADQTADKDASRRLAAAFTALVERDYHSGNSVRAYARQLGVTPTHLSRACNIACSKPASKILADRVHFEARRMLRDTTNQVKDIAVQLGFGSAAYFTRAFQKHTGSTPSNFRNSE